MTYDPKDLRDVQTAIGSKPWNAPSFRVPPELASAHGMLGPEERASLYWIGRHYCKGQGDLVDAGAFLGTSGLALAAGLKANPAAGSTKVWSYDTFRAEETYVADYIRHRFPSFRDGAPFRSLFDEQTASAAGHIRAQEGDFLEAPAPEGPIEVLFVDLDKSLALHRRFLADFYTKLVPGGLLIHQDWFLSRHPWLHYGMEFLSDHLELVDAHVLWCTRIFRLRRPIPASALRTLADEALGYEQELALMDRLMAREASGLMREMLFLARITHMLQRGHAEAARADFGSAVFHHLDNDGLRGEHAYVRSIVQS